MWHPRGSPQGVSSVVDGLFKPLRAALQHAHRRDEIFIAGPNQRAEGIDWIASVTHDLGTFHAPFFGILPAKRLAFLRAGKFYRVKNGQIVQARIILDLPDLMRQAGRDPFGGGATWAGNTFPQARTL